VQIAPVQGHTHVRPVQPTPPVAPVKAKPEEHHEDHPKVKSTPPPGVGTKVDVQA
jgi:hypothetical protein